MTYFFYNSSFKAFYKGARGSLASRLLGLTSLLSCVLFLPAASLALTLTLTLILPSAIAFAAASDSRDTVVQRQQYRLALKDLSKNRLADFRERQSGLKDYLLAPYLEYHYHRKVIERLSSADVKKFRDTYSDYPFAERLQDRWLLRLPGQGRWNDYLTNYEPSRSATRRCYYLRALYRSGQRKAALDQVEPLWLHGKSQPKACDSLFETWIGAGYLNDSLVWQRMMLALARNEVTLAKYLKTLVKTTAFKSHAEALYQAHTQPQTRFNIRAHHKDTLINRQIIRVGLMSLARRDADDAIRLWRDVQQSHQFTGSARADIEARLFIEAAEDSQFAKLSERPAELSDSTLALIAREAVRQQNWEEAKRWIAQMTETQRAEPEWRYWQNRSQGSNQHLLAAERNYYGFLAASDLGIDTRLNHEPTNVSPDALAAVRTMPGFRRSLELYAVDDLINARREWLRAFEPLNAEQKAAAAHLAQRHGWLDQSILAANAARLRNDLNLRFPQVFANLYGKAGHATNIPISTLMAVTRQESAFAHRARSSANARGLMQLLPATAKRTAKKAGLRTPTTLDLYEPAINIRIASEYLASLMDRYDQQRPLAFAAYNAGEHRVDRWIQDRAGMPMEVWIETIPFRETRGYVKSVLAFNHLYSKRLNQPMPLLMPHEQKVGQHSSVAQAKSQAPNKLSPSN